MSQPSDIRGDLVTNTERPEDMRGDQAHVTDATAITEPVDMFSGTEGEDLADAEAAVDAELFDNTSTTVDL